jgi:hypothetical protein
MSRRFPPQPDGSEPGVDALLDPARQLTSIEKAGFFFAPPYHEQGLAAAVFAEYDEQPRAAGRLVVHKRIIDPSHASRRFERGGFTLQILDAQNQPIPNSQFATDSNGRGICPVTLTIGQELSSPVQNVQPRSIPFTMQHLKEQLHVVNQCRRTLPTAAHEPRRETSERGRLQLEPQLTRVLHAVFVESDNEARTASAGRVSRVSWRVGGCPAGEGVGGSAGDVGLPDGEGAGLSDHAPLAAWRAVEPCAGNAARGPGDRARGGVEAADLFEPTGESREHARPSGEVGYHEGRAGDVVGRRGVRCGFEHEPIANQAQPGLVTR